jgi:hypothetical protein
MDAGFLATPSTRARVEAAASAALMRVFMYDRSENREARLFDGRHHSAACG